MKTLKRNTHRKFADKTSGLRVEWERVFLPLRRQRFFVGLIFDETRPY